MIDKQTNKQTNYDYDFIDNNINTIINDDCFNVICKIPSNSIDCIYVDVPYLIDKHGYGNSDLAKRLAKRDFNLYGTDEKDYNENLTIKENIRINKNKINSLKDLVGITNGFDYKKFIKESFRIMKIPNMFIWCSKNQIRDITNEIHKYCNRSVDILVWCKTNPIPTTNNVWLSDVEYCLYIRENGVKLNDGYDLKSKFYVSGINQEDKKKYKHPTIKPLELVERHLKHATQPNDIVLDCFCGSGTTCLASKNIGRRYIGIELSEKWYKVALDRLNGIDQNGQTSLMLDFK